MTIIFAYISAIGFLLIDGFVSSWLIKRIMTSIISEGVPVNPVPNIWIIIICFGVASGLLGGLCFIWLARPHPELHAILYLIGVLFLYLFLSIIAGRIFNDSGNSWDSVMNDLLVIGPYLLSLLLTVGIWKLG